HTCRNPKNRSLRRPRLFVFVRGPSLGGRVRKRPPLFPPHFRSMSFLETEDAMKVLLPASLAALLLAITPLPSAAGPDTPDWTALPTDKVALEELDQQQLRALRGSVRACNDLARSDHSGVPCVFLDLDRVMRQEEDAALRAYHF